MYCLKMNAAGSRELKKHLISLNADSWTPADIRNNLPTDAIYPVDRTVFDLRLPTQLTKRRLYIVPGGGYNQNLCINSPSSWSYRFHARTHALHLKLNQEDIRNDKIHRCSRTCLHLCRYHCLIRIRLRPRSLSRRISRNP